MECYILNCHGLANTMKHIISKPKKNSLAHSLRRARADIYFSEMKNYAKSNCVMPILAVRLNKIEHHRKITCLRDFRPGQAQNTLLSHRRQLAH